MVSNPTLGDQELAVLRHIADAGGATVGEVADSFGAERGLARSTILTVMERLRQKGFLSRRRIAGVYRYASRASAGDVLRNAVRGFVERTLAGSVSPVVAYLAEREEVSASELAELEDLVSKLQARRKER